MIEELQDQAVTPEAQRTNLIDTELDEAEIEAVAADRLDLIRAVIDDLGDWDTPFYRQAAQAGAIQESRPDGGETKAFHLSHAMTPTPRNDSHERFLETPRRRVIRVGQQILWDVVDDKKNYFWASMSECSFLMARKEGRVAAVHIGYGQAGDLRVAADYMREAGFDLRNAVAIINARPPLSQPDSNQASRAMRHAGPETYEALGLKRENVHTYDYTYAGQDGEGVGRGLVQLIATPDNVFLYAFDTHQEDGGQVRKGPYYNDTVIRLA